MIIPPHLLQAVESGSAVLMLGAGASLAASDSQGNKPPTTSQLTKRLCDRFLSPTYESYTLSQVGDYAMSESSLFEVQEFIREILSPFKPSASHMILPTFRWRAIVTTNYDRLIEDAYETSANPVQKLVPLYKNTDRWDDVMRDPDFVPLLKLHGCISKTHDEDCPMILSIDQYVKYNLGRDRLFRLFQELAAERTFLHIGFSNTDPDIRALIQQLDAEKVGRPRSFLITPSVDPITERYWAPRQITALAGTLDEAVAALDSSIGFTFRGLRPTTPKGTLAIADRFASTSVKLSEATLKSLSLDLEYVNAASPDSVCDAVKFYSGVSQSWAPIVQGLDVKRRLHETLICEGAIRLMRPFFD